MSSVLRAKPQTRLEMPACHDYQDPDTVLAFERAVRRYRGLTETFTIQSVDGRAEGAFQVEGDSERRYVVDLVDASGKYDTCTCGDWLFGAVGTCKHVEAVRSFFDGTRRRPSGLRGLPSNATTPTLSLEENDGARALAWLGTWPRRASVDRAFPRVPGGGRAIARVDELTTGRRPDGLRVTHAVPVFVKAQQARAARMDRTARLTHELSRGRVSLDVLRKKLFPYQETGVAHLVRAGRALLADDMGLGKTVQALAACELLRARGEASRILIVTVASLKHQWAREIEACTGSRAVVVGGGLAQRRRALQSDAPYLILNYELTWRELTGLRALDADVLVLDEAQRAKNFRTKTAHTLRTIPSRHLFVLTGTPVENRLDDLYALLQLVDPELLGPLWKFNLEFHQQSDSGAVIGARNLGLLRQRLAPVMLRRRKEEVLMQLPAITHQTRYTPMLDEQLEISRGYLNTISQLMKILERRPLTVVEQNRLMAALTKSRQACNAIELADSESPRKGSPKLDEFESLIGEIVQQGSAKVLAFSEWKGMLDLAAARLDALGVRWEMLHGGVSSEKRPALLDRFRSDPDVRVLLSTDAGGVGLNLQEASYVVHLDLPWNPGRLDQRTARSHRMGQTRGVLVTYLVAESGMERNVERALSGKRKLRAAAIDGADVEAVDASKEEGFFTLLEEVMAASVLVTAEAGRGGTVAGTVALAEPGTEASAEGLAVRTAWGEDAAVGEVVAVEEAVGVVVAVEEAVGVVEGVVEAEGIGVEATAVGVAAVVGAETGRGEGVSAERRAVPGSGLGQKARERLRFAGVVLEAGFGADAVQAAYDALASALRSRAEEDSPVGASHGELVAALYRSLVPSGRVPAPAALGLARLRDLTLLREHGVDVDAETAREAVREAGEWVERMMA